MMPRHDGADDDAAVALPSRRHGQSVVLLDTDGAAGVEFGVSGVPETFAVSQDGTILAKHSGELTPEIADRLLASADQSAKR